ncbi:MAG: hypothetical protein WC875_05850, partial [Candidatus Absconditabacterales bacterium]
NDVFAISEGMEDTCLNVEELLVIIEKVRGYKTEKQQGLGTELATLEITSKKDLSEYADDIKSVTRAQEVSFMTGESTEIKVG